MNYTDRIKEQKGSYTITRESLLDEIFIGASLLLHVFSFLCTKLHAKKESITSLTILILLSEFVYC